MGFTLVELLVVIVIVGLLGAAVVVAVPDGRPTLTAEAERFAARLVRAREEAVLTNRPVTVRVDAVGYGFETRRRGAWTALEEGPFRPTAWESGGAPVLPQDAEAVRIGFDVTGAAEPAVVTLAREARTARVVVDAAGRVRVDAGA